MYEGRCASIYIPKNVMTAIDILHTAGFEAYPVGGCVRDSLMNIRPKDYDITSNALPQQCLECFKNFHTISNGIKHGTVAVIIDGECIEITTFRIDGSYSDGRHPDSVTFSAELKDDLSRRDFTVNAMAYDIKNGVVDCFGGVRDLENRLIRCVGDPDKRFNEDALRIMRALRFSSVLGFEIEKTTAESIHNNAFLLKGISKERILAELSKLLTGENAYKVVKDYADVLSVIFGTAAHSENNALFIKAAEVIQNSNRRKSDVILAFCCLMCLDFSPDGAYAALLELKSPRELRDNVKAVLGAGVTFDFEPDRVFARRLLSEYGIENAKRIMDLCSSADPRKKADCAEAEKMIDEVINDGDCINTSELDINGAYISQELGLFGREIGNMLQCLLSAVISGKVINRRKELAEYAKTLRNSAKGDNKENV